MARLTTCCAAALSALALSCSAGAQAASITYNLSQSLGPASVSGYITTDGKLGELGAGNIIDWSLLLNDGSSSDPLSSLGKVSLSTGNSQLASFSVFSATATDLLFDFGGSGGAAFQRPLIGSNSNFLAFDGVYGGSGVWYSAISWEIMGAPIIIEYSGLQSIAQAVPEPASYALLAAGLGLLAWRRRSSAPRA